MSNDWPQGSQCELPPIPVCDAPPVAPSLLLDIVQSDGGLLSDFRYVQLLCHLDPTRFGPLECDGLPIECAEAKVLAWDPTTQNWVSTGEIICVCDFVGNRMYQYDRAIVKREPQCITSDECGVQDCIEGPQGTSEIWWIYEVHEFGAWVELTDRDGKAYSWKEKIHDGNGNWIYPPCPREGEFNLFDVNNSSHNSQGGVHPLIVWARRGKKLGCDETELVLDYSGTWETPEERYNFDP